MPLVTRPMQPTESDLSAYKACFDANHTSARDARTIAWLYQRNPVDQTFVNFAIDQATERVAAIYATMPVWAQIDGKRVLAVQSLDTLTDKDFRGAGLFKSQAQAVYKRCTESGVAFVYGFPNGNSAHGFFNRLGWTPLDPLPFLFLPIRPAYFLKRLGVPERVLDHVPDVRRPFRALPRLASNEEIRTVETFDASFDQLWSEFSAGVRFAVVRDAAYLRWRMSKPAEDYMVVALRRAGEMIAWVAYTTTNKHRGRVGYVLELLHKPGEDNAAAHLLGHAVRDMARNGADVIMAWNLDSSPNHPAYRKVGFRGLPERVRPIELHFGVRGLAAASDLPLGNRDNWYLSYLDSDTV